LMDDKNVQKLLKKNCVKDYETLNCPITKKPGQLLACVLDHRAEIKNPSCRGLVQRLEWVAFSDFRLIGSFVNDCEADIEQLGCGRLSGDRKKTSQGKTIACLQTYIDKLKPECRKGVLHISEIQSDNVKLDRQLFLACVTDAIRFCPDARAGSGAVYKCLMKNKGDPSMSQHCQEQLLRRDKLIAHDYKVSRGLARACKEDIRINHCRKGVSDDKDIRLAQILLCLEAAHKNSTKITSDCKYSIVNDSIG
jgi:golgi apparatus protein 1